MLLSHQSKNQVGTAVKIQNLNSLKINSILWVVIVSLGLAGCERPIPQVENISHSVQQPSLDAQSNETTPQDADSKQDPKTTDDVTPKTDDAVKTNSEQEKLKFEYRVLH